MRALLIVDVQNDFCEGGSLAVAGGRQVAVDADRLLKSYSFVVASADWHVDPGKHFEEWPPHCVAGTPGANFCEPLSPFSFDAVVRKGARAAAYSAFDGTPLARLLERQRVTELDVCGIATDHCVRASVIDALALPNLSVRVLLGLCAGVAPDTTAAAVEEMERAGAKIVR